MSCHVIIIIFSSSVTVAKKDLTKRESVIVGVTEGPKTRLE